MWELWSRLLENSRGLTSCSYSRLFGGMRLCFFFFFGGGSGLLYYSTMKPNKVYTFPPGSHSTAFYWGSELGSLGFAGSVGAWAAFFNVGAYPRVQSKQPESPQELQ